MDVSSFATPTLHQGPSKGSWWADRSVKTKVLSAVSVAAVVAGSIGVLGINGMSTAAESGEALYEDNFTGGFGAEVAATIAQDAFDYLDGPVTRIASPDVPIAPYSGILEEYVLPNPEKIAEGIRTLAGY